MRKASKRMKVLEDQKGGPLSDGEAMGRAGLSRESLDDLRRFKQGYLSLFFMHLYVLDLCI